MKDYEKKNFDKIYVITDLENKLKVLLIETI